jgi:hypothetical protein
MLTFFNNNQVSCNMITCMTHEKDHSQKSTYLPLAPVSWFLYYDDIKTFKC